MNVVNECSLCKWRGKLVVLQTLEDDPMRYCIQYVGSGQYFPSEGRALTYAHGRGWFSPSRYTANHCGKEVKQSDMYGLFSA